MGFTIQGSEKFDAQVKSALTLLSKKTPDHFANVLRYAPKIVQGQHSGMWADRKPPTIELHDRTTFYSVTWLAGTLVHESHHSFLYHEYKTQVNFSDYNWRGKEAELKCMEVQLDAMQRIGAPAKEINYLRKLDGTYYDVNKDGKETWEDYAKRNW